MLGPYDAFLAYPSAERPTAQRLFDLLKESLRIFFDVDSITLGTPWSIQLREAQQASKATVFLLSDKARDAFYLEAEVHQAISQFRVDGRHKVIPVYLNGRPGAYNWSLYGINQLQGIEADPLRIEEAAQRILAVLGGQSNQDVPSLTAVKQHFLDSFEDYPVVRLESIPRVLLDEFSIRYDQPIQARLLIAEANRYRHEQDPTAGVIEPFMLPAPEIGIFDYWTRAFVQAGLQGPRMLAALLVRASDRQFSEEGRRSRKSLIEHLSRISQSISS
jgi:hypothetical protein